MPQDAHAPFVLAPFNLQHLRLFELGQPRVCQVERNRDRRRAIRREPLVRQIKMHGSNQSCRTQFGAELFGPLGQLVVDLERQVTHAEIKQLFVGKAGPVRGQRGAAHPVDLKVSGVGRQVAEVSGSGYQTYTVSSRHSLSSSTLTAGQDRDRSAIDDKYKWNLTDIYPDLATWRRAKDGIARELPSMRQYQGKLGSSAQCLVEALDEAYRLDKEIARLSVYAGMLADQDTREAGPQGMQQEMQQLTADFKAHVSYMEPELLHVGLTKLKQFIAAEPRLQTYSFYLHDSARRATHTLSDTEEKILADAIPLAVSGHNIYNILANADFPYPTITLSDGRTARVDPSGYAELRTLPNREDREKAMSTFFRALGGFSRTFGTMMNANVQRAAFYAKTRRYGSHLEAALDAPNIPVSVYTRLIEGIGRALPSFHRYLKLRRKMMNIADSLRYHDLYAPLVAEVDITFTPEQAQQQILTAMQPLGGEYCDVVARSFNERWIDFFPTMGKRSGAYSEGGAYDVHPYMLLNYLGQYNDVSTLAHELGHTMHSFYSNTMQPYALANYPTFVAEVASTFNEALLIDHMLRDTTDPATRLSLLGNVLENVKATVFRQTQFAEFELRMHQMAER